MKSNKVFIAKSLDGYIAGVNDELDWLEVVPNTNSVDMGYTNFISGVDALLMGSKTFNVVSNFDGEWIYTIPVFVLSNSLTKVPDHLESKVQIVSGPVKYVVEVINQQGFNHLYIDGASVIQQFFEEDLIDEMTITTIPILLGGGVQLFGKLKDRLLFHHVKSQVFLGEIVQDTYRRNCK